MPPRGRGCDILQLVHGKPRGHRLEIIPFAVFHSYPDRLPTVIFSDLSQPSTAWCDEFSATIQWYCTRFMMTWGHWVAKKMHRIHISGGPMGSRFVTTTGQRVTIDLEQSARDCGLPCARGTRLSGCLDERFTLKLIFSSMDHCFNWDVPSSELVVILLLYGDLQN